MVTKDFRAWHDEQRTCVFINNGASKATIRLTRLEAEQLRQQLVPPEAPGLNDANGDAGEWERLYGLGAGHVLTEADVKDIENLIADWNDELGRSANTYHEGRLAAYRELGGDELVEAAEAKATAIVDRAVAQAMKAFRERADDAALSVGAKEEKKDDS